MFPLYDLNPHRRFPLLTVAIIAINALVTLLMSGMGEDRASMLAFKRGFVPIRYTRMNTDQPLLVAVPAVDERGHMVVVGAVQLSTSRPAVYSTFITTMFLHGGWMHMLSNMWILWIFGNNIEDRLGHFLYPVYYLLGGVAATACHWAVNPNSDLPVVGASGAVAAVLGGYALTFPWAKIRTLIFFGLVFIIDVPALAWLGIWFIGQNVIPALFSLGRVTHDPIAYWAHIGGFLAGAVLMPIFSFVAPSAPPEPTDQRPAADDMFQYNDPRSGRR